MNNDQLHVIAEALWQIAEALHSVKPKDRNSLDTLVGCTTMVIANAAELEKIFKENDKKEKVEISADEEVDLTVTKAEEV